MNNIAKYAVSVRSTFVLLFPSMFLLLSYSFYIFIPTFVLLFHKGVLDSLPLEWGVILIEYPWKEVLFV